MITLSLLQELVINPVHQELDQFNWVMAWQDIMPAHQMASAATCLPCLSFVLLEPRIPGSLLAISASLARQ